MRQVGGGRSESGGGRREVGDLGGGRETDKKDNMKAEGSKCARVRASMRRGAGATGRPGETCSMERRATSEQWRRAKWGGICRQVERQRRKRGDGEGERR